MISEILASVPVKPRRGRPRRAGDARILACAEAVIDGETPDQVAKRLGVHRATAYRWLRKAHA